MDTELRDFLLDKFKSDDIIIETLTKQDYATKQKYNAFKIGFSEAVGDDDIFNSENWPSNINIKFFRTFRKPQRYNRKLGTKNNARNPNRK